MKKTVFLFSILFIILFSLIFYKISFKKESSNTCSVVEIKCPDGFSSRCNSIYDSPSKTCIDCIPDCTGHETPINRTENNSSGLVLCPEVLPSQNFCKDGEIIPIYNDIGCVVGYKCESI
jgi:hypothetical protein